MWISKKEYEKMKSDIEAFERDAMAYRRISLLTGNAIVFVGDNIVMTKDALNGLIPVKTDLENKIKDIEAELEWYKVKYHDMKVRNSFLECSEIDKKTLLNEIIDTINKELDESPNSSEYVCVDGSTISTDVGYVSDWFNEYADVLRKKYCSQE